MAAGLVTTGLALTSCGTDGVIHVSPGKSGPVDEPVHIRITGQAPGATVSVTATARFLGRSWHSSALYAADGSGSVDPDKQAPLSGSYAGVAGMGLFWSLTSSGPVPSVADLGRPETVHVEMTGKRAGAVDLTRMVAADDVSARAVRPGRSADIYGELLVPSAAGRAVPGVVLVGGAEGGLNTGLPVAEALASHGLAVLDLAYFGAPGLPAHLDRIPIGYFAEALAWLGRQAGVDRHRLYLYGVSRGTEAALLTASYFPDLARGVVALAPSNSVLCGAPACTDSGWTYQGRALPFTQQVSNPRPTDVPAAVIPIGRFPGRVLLVCAGHDRRWDSCAYSRAISDALVAAGHPAATVLDYPQAGHGVGFSLPYLPDLDSPTLAGVTPDANPRARADEWPRIVAFLTRP